MSTTTTTTNPKRHAFTAEAMMIRELHAYRASREEAKKSGADVSAEHDPPTFAALSDRYDQLLDEWVTEDPDSITGVMAYLDLVAAIIDGERAVSRGDRDAVLSTERDLGYALQLLTTARRWLNEQDVNDLIKEERAKHPEVATIMETLGKRDADADLLALILAYRHQHAEGTGTGDMLDKIHETRPTTLRGVLAVLDLISDLDIDSSLFWPEEAIEGLREIAAREARS
jgi:hypothetical protein